MKFKNGDFVAYRLDGSPDPYNRGKVIDTGSFNEEIYAVELSGGFYFYATYWELVKV